MKKATRIKYAFIIISYVKSDES